MEKKLTIMRTFYGSNFRKVIQLHYNDGGTIFTYDDDPYKIDSELVDRMLFAMKNGFTIEYEEYAIKDNKVVKISSKQLNSNSNCCVNIGRVNELTIL